MPVRYPPLLSLRAFEAAARHLSFTHAADELCLTQSAVSRHVRSLEDYLGQRMFDRLTRRVELTPAGEEYFRAVHHALAEIEKATRDVMQPDRKASLTLSVMPTLGANWLMPRLGSFSETYPDIEVRMISSIEPVNFDAREIDVAIRVGSPHGVLRDKHLPRVEMDMVTNWKGVTAEYLFPDLLVPVLSSKLLSQGAAINEARDLLKYRLIHNASREYAWPDWLAAHDVTLTEKTDAITYGHFFMTIRAALNCKGVALIPSVILNNCLEGMDLVQPLKGDVESAGSYYLLTREENRNEYAVRTFCNWLLAEADNEKTRDLAVAPDDLEDVQQ